MPLTSATSTKISGSVRHTRMEIGEIAAIVVETVLQVVPALDRMDRLVGDQLLEQRAGRGVPGDPAQLEKVNVEPGREQTPEIVLEAGSAGSSRTADSSSARMLTRNLTPSGRLLNLGRSLHRGGSSACRSLRRARRRSARLVAACHSSIAVSTSSSTTSKSRPACAETARARSRRAPGTPRRAPRPARARKPPRRARQDSPSSAGAAARDRPPANPAECSPPRRRKRSRRCCAIDSAACAAPVAAGCLRLPPWSEP